MRVICHFVMTSLCALLFAHFAVAKSALPPELTSQSEGKPTSVALDRITNTLGTATSNISTERFKNVASSANAVTNYEEALLHLSRREYVILVDASGSMGNHDPSPVDGSPGTLLNSMKIAVHGLLDVLLRFDSNNEIDIYAFQGSGKGDKSITHATTVRNKQQLETFFNELTIGGATPTAEALDVVFRKKMEPVIQANETVTCLVFTDGEPNDKESVFKFFESIQKKYGSKLKDKLATWSFIRMGDDPRAIQFLDDLDDDDHKIFKYDIIDTKTDNFIFKTDSEMAAIGKEQGALATLYDAIFD